MSDGWSKAAALFSGAHRVQDSSKVDMELFQHRNLSGDQTQAQSSFGDKPDDAGPPGACLNDGRRRIDFVLVYQMADAEFRKVTSSTRTVATDKAQRRAFFEANLIKEGLVLEKDEWRRKDSDAVSEDAEAPSASTAANSITVFVKVHGPFQILGRYAEKLNVKVPLKLRDAFAAANVVVDAADDQQKRQRVSNLYRSIRQRSVKRLKATNEIFRKPRSPPIDASTTMTTTATPSITVQQEGDKMTSPIDVKEKEKETKAPYVTHRFRRRNINMYAGAENQDEFFTPTQRIEIVWEILQKARNDPEDEKKRGIELLVETGVYECAFPLHDGDDYSGKDKNKDKAHDKAEDKGRRESSTVAASKSLKSERQLLRRTWADWYCLAKPQPLNVIRRYYGEKVAFYFAFLGFYTKMLIYPGLFGLATFLYGLISSEANTSIINDVCVPNTDPGNRTMCPICRPPNCGFTNLSDGCTNAKWNYHTDNPATLALACFTVVWATVFLKMWKRREAELAYEWDTYDIEEHEEESGITPEYERRAPASRPNAVTRELEPYVPTHMRFLRSALSTCITLLILCAVGVTLVCLVMGRIALYGAFKQAGFQYYVEMGRWSAHGLIFITVVLFDVIYDRVARKLTSLECPRTASEWLSSFLWKVFIFELLNDFIPICYVAWVKGKTVRTPLDLTWYSEMCEGGYCMSEVMELVAVLLLARLVIGNAVEIGVPFLKRVYARTFRFRNKNSNSSNENLASTGASGRLWRLDYLLGELELDGVAEEYMEMIVQFAYCTLFVPALPVAPFVCFLNNILEIRIDAINLTAGHRRPLPIRVAGIGIWYDFLNVVTKLAVFCNAGLIAFTSQTVQRLRYSYSSHANGANFDDYQRASLSSLPAVTWTPEFKTAASDLHSPDNITECYYADYRKDYSPFDVRLEWWETMCARVATFAAFVLASFTFQWLFNFVVSDVPSHVKLKIQRRRYVVAKATEAGGAYDLWLSKAVRRESKWSRASVSTARLNRDGDNDQKILIDQADRAAPDQIRETGSENLNQEEEEAPAASQQNADSKGLKPATSMVKRWKHVTFGTRPRMQTHSISMTRSQKTLDAVDIEEEDM